MLNLHIILKNITIFAFRNGALAKRLCTGLQNQVGRFDSATHLKVILKTPIDNVLLGFCGFSYENLLRFCYDILEFLMS